MESTSKYLSQPVTLSIGEIIGKPRCITVRDGDKIYERIAPMIRNGAPVRLSFDGVRIVISSFLNAAIGQLLSEFRKDEIDKLISYQGLSDRDMERVFRVIKNAQIFFERQNDYDRAWKEVVGDHEEE